MGQPLLLTLSNVTVEDADALDCGVCFLPLKSPIFQCDVGHVVCTPCRDKLEAGGGDGCHVCGAAGRFCRCHAMEWLVVSISVPCPHAAHGCGARPVYHRHDAHARVCAHAPCRCPDEACRFAASTAELLLHLAAAHGWPCFTMTSVGDIVSFTVELRDGFNFVRAAARNGQGPYHLFLLNTAMEDAGCAVNVVCIQPRAVPPSKEMMFELQYSRYKDVRDSSRQFVNHYQKSEFRVVCTDLSDGLPDPNDGFQFVVPWAVLGDEDIIQVTASAYVIK